MTLEEGTWATWLYDLLKPHVDELVVCNPGKNALLKDGNKSDRIDARKLAELLRGNQLKPVYHGETSVRMLRELARSYLTIVKDVSRVMNRLKALYRNWAIPCAGRDVYYTRHRAEWLAKIQEAGVRRRAERLYLQLDMLNKLRQQARRERLAESRKPAITSKLRQIPYLGPIRSALAVALIQTPHRFRTKRQLWAYSGLALETRISGEYSYATGQLRRSKKLISLRGLNKDHNHDLKGLFISIPGRHPGGGQSVLETLGFEGEYANRLETRRCRWHPVSGLTLCPLGQPEKALGHESQMEPWLTPYHHQGLPVFRTEWRRRDQKMELLRWNNADSNPGAQPQTSVFRSDKGLDVANKNRAYGEGRRMFLTSLLIEPGDYTQNHGTTPWKALY